MPQDNRLGAREDGYQLGASFEESQSPSHGADLGPAFAEHNQTPNHPSRTWIWITLIVVIVAAFFLIHHYSGDTASKAGAGAAGASGAKGGGRGQTGPAAITVGQSKSGDINIYVDALGTVTPTATVTVYSQITGKILAVHYAEGQFVAKGQPLVDIDPAPYKATLDQAEGSLKHDQALLAEAKMDLTRYQEAAAKNAIARQQPEDQEKIVLQDEGTVQADQGTVDYDKVQLAYCHIVAPVSGRVGLRLVDPGNTVFSGSSSTLVVITAMQPITAVFNVSEDDLPSVQAQLKTRKALEVDVFDRGNDTQLDTGALTSLDNQIDTTTGTIKFRATFPNKNLALFPNQFVNTRLLLTTLKNATLVPTAAVQHNGTAAFVYVVKPDPKDASGNIVKVQAITTSTSNDDVTAVQGLNPGVSLATSGFDRLEDGAQVKAQSKGQKGAPGGSGSTTGQNGNPGGVSPSTSAPASTGSTGASGSSGVSGATGHHGHGGGKQAQ